jgi:hypothetical protein
MRLLSDDEVITVMQETGGAAPGIRDDVLNDAQCGPPLRVFLALCDRRVGRDLTEQDRFFNLYYWFLRMVKAYRRNFGYDAGIEDQLSQVFEQAVSFDVDESHIEEIERAAEAANRRASGARGK